ncbi:hypothetical protein SELMODRAFT_411101 [Selaginella moellendorffii]|uniref:Uncharacterized protein n=1 Tax=Selaginella moellendorffii TaxID=88036 RepID=D8RGK8_SELML|nr:hypothetical protein SELMODRAFT_411101 [Selaginella moellendorffii]
MEDKPKRTKKVEEPKLPASRKGDVEEVADGAKAKPKKTKVVETEAKLLAPRKDLGSNEAIEAKPKPKRSRKVKGEEEKDSSVSGNGKEVTKAKSKGTKKVPVEEGMESELSAPGQRKTSKPRTQSAKKVEETVKDVGTVGLVAENSMELEKKVEKRPPKPGRQAAKKMELLDEAARIAGTDEFVENNLDSEISVPLVEESGASQQALDDAAKPQTTETVKVAETDNVVVEKDSKVAEPSPDQAKTQHENVVTAGAKQDGFLEVDDELKEFLMDRKLQQEQGADNCRKHQVPRVQDLIPGDSSEVGPDGEGYFDQKQWYSVIMQGVYDAQKRFPVDGQYNQQHHLAQIVIEQAFGLLKMKFICLIAIIFSQKCISRRYF